MAQRVRKYCIAVGTSLKTSKLMVNEKVLLSLICKELSLVKSETFDSNCNKSRCCGCSWGQKRGGEPYRVPSVWCCCSRSLMMQPHVAHFPVSCAEVDAGVRRGSTFCSLLQLHVARAFYSDSHSASLGQPTSSAAPSHTEHSYFTMVSQVHMSHEEPGSLTGWLQHICPSLENISAFK